MLEMLLLPMITVFWRFDRCKAKLGDTFDVPIMGGRVIGVVYDSG